MSTSGGNCDWCEARVEEGQGWLCCGECSNKDDAVDRDLRTRLAAAEAKLAERLAHTYCAFCGHATPMDDDAGTKIRAHVMECEKHPLNIKLAVAEAENTRLKRAIEAHQLQSVGWRETTVVDRELWAAGVEEGT